MFFSRPFYAVDGMNDNRVANLLRQTGLEAYAKYPEKDTLDFDDEIITKAVVLLQPLKEQSLIFLQNDLSYNYGDCSSL